MNCVQRSITEKWEPILRGEHESQGADDCSCCQEHYFRYDERGMGCSSCPIRNYTGRTRCAGTPNDSFEILKERCRYDIHAELTACAQWEIDFLHEVLNNGEG